MTIGRHNMLQAVRSACD